MIIHFDIYVSRFPKNKNMHTMKQFEGISFIFPKQNENTNDIHTMKNFAGVHRDSI